MLARESVQARMAGEQGISFTEFSYMLLQANDYLWLHDHMGCELQVGGSDQWGNILSGVDLIRRRPAAPRARALAGRCITAADGTKLGKTTGARIWLDPDRTSPYRFFQHWMNTDDREVRRFLAQFTLLPVAEVDAVVAEHLAASRAAAGPAAPGRGGHRARPRAEAAAAAAEAASLDPVRRPDPRRHAGRRSTRWPPRCPSTP